MQVRPTDFDDLDHIADAGARSRVQSWLEDPGVMVLSYLGGEEGPPVAYLAVAERVHTVSSHVLGVLVTDATAVQSATAVLLEHTLTELVPPHHAVLAAPAEELMVQVYLRQGFEATGEGVGVFGQRPRRLLALPPRLSPPQIAEPVEPSPPIDGPPTGTLPDYSLRGEDLTRHAPPPAEESALTETQRRELDDFIRRARERRGGGGTALVAAEVDSDVLVLEPLPEDGFDPREFFEDYLGERLSAYFGAYVLPAYLQIYGRDEHYRRVRDAGLATLIQEPLHRRPRKKKMLNIAAELTEYFIVESARELHGGLLSQRILRQQGKSYAELNVFDLIVDYLQPQQMDDAVYLDFETVPVRVLRGAMASYLQTGRDERPILLCDQSLTGSGKRGFALTDAGLYWKPPLHPAAAVTFTTVREVCLRDGYLHIDGRYFNGGAVLNLRLAMLLDRLRRLPPEM